MEVIIELSKTTINTFLNKLKLDLFKSLLDESLCSLLLIIGKSMCVKVFVYSFHLREYRFNRLILWRVFCIPYWDETYLSDLI